MNIAVIGANGQLGSDICEVFKTQSQSVAELKHNQIDIVNFELSRQALGDVQPDLVVNTAAMHNVEKCENEPAKAFAVNGIGVRNLAVLSNELNFTLLHFSTDAVVDGSQKTPYIETEPPLPVHVYGNTKLSGEYFVRTISQKYFIVRTSGLYGKHPCRAKGGDNFVTFMLRLAKERDEVRVVDDEILTPTYTYDLAEQIAKLSQCTNYGLYHVTAQGCCSWYQFAAKIFELAKVKVKLSIASPSEFPAKVPRPKYTVLENAALKSINIDSMPYWEDCLKKYLNPDLP